MNKKVIQLLLLLSFLTGCHPKSALLEPNVCYVPTEGTVWGKCSAFAPLTEEERNTEWGKEYLIAGQFAREMDLYRAITGYKRALFLCPPQERQLQIEYHILECYYLGRKYFEVIENFEKGSLTQVSSQFPAIRELLIIINDSYRQIGCVELADQILQVLEKGDPETAEDLKLFQAVSDGCLEEMQCYDREEINLFLNCYARKEKSVCKAQTLNALFPGAGYYYVGQKRSAITSFLLNASFIYASVFFFDQGNIGAGIITTSLEFGWYFGGINGAGLAAKQYNETLYNCTAQELMIKKKLFPVLMWQHAF